MLETIQDQEKVLPTQDFHQLLLGLYLTGKGDLDSIGNRPG
jgi:hypothetical protein